MDGSEIRRCLRRMSGIQVAAILALMGIGVLFIYSAGYRGVGESPSLFYRKQMVWCAVSLGLYLALTVADYHRAGELAWALYLGSVAFLILVLLAGRTVHGARRWLDVFGFRWQPSELSKVALVVALARYLTRPGRDPARGGVAGACLAMVAVPLALIAKQPDLGTALVLVPVLITMLFAAGVPLRTLLFLVLMGAMLFPVGWLALDDYQKERLLVFVDPQRDPLGAGWNKLQSEIAVGSGGFSGKGYLKGTQNVLGFLPRTVAPTDFIYSVIAEETGFVGSVILLALFGILLATCVYAALRARDSFGRLLCVGVAALIFSHVYINIAMTVGLMPITGLPLPLISYGGTFTLCTMAALGLVQSVYVRRYRRA